MVAVSLRYERTLSILETETFLREISRNSELPVHIRNHAKDLLRHSPSADQIFSLGRLEESLAQEKVGKAVPTRLVGPHQPLFCSSLNPSMKDERLSTPLADTPCGVSPGNQRAALKGDGFSAGLAEGTSHLGQVRIRAAEVFNDEAVAAAWLTEPNVVLGEESPESLCASEAGAQRVLKALNAIEWGGAV